MERRNRSGRSRKPFFDSARRRRPRYELNRNGNAAMSVFV
jgi:hypothetical protein